MQGRARLQEDGGQSTSLMLPGSRGFSGLCENQGSRADTWSLLGSQRVAQQGRRLLRLRVWGRRSPLGTCDTVPALSQLAGGVILGVALWLRHDPQTTNLLYLELGDKPAPNTFYVGECTCGHRRIQGGLPGGGRA